MVVHKTFSDFVLFLYLHIAYSDKEFHSTERTVILDKMLHLYPGDGNREKKLDEADAAYRAMDKSNVLQLIRDTFEHFKQVKFAQKYKVYTDMYDIIRADGRVHEAEQNRLNELKEIIDVDAQARGKK
ncbi:MAG: TerB family tellurite resistance protein [Cyclobacteriaceae bacterium]